MPKSTVVCDKNGVNDPHDNPSIMLRKVKTWEKERQLTNNSEMSHSYVRKVVNGKAPFCFFWADGHSHEFSKSEFWFGDFDGNVRKLPYEMQNETAKPEKMYKKNRAG